MHKIFSLLKIDTKRPELGKFMELVSDADNLCVEVEEKAIINLIIEKALAYKVCLIKNVELSLASQGEDPSMVIRKLSTSLKVETLNDYDEYCHYVAGLDGFGLSKLFHASRKEDLLSDSLSNSMGLFLQKTNIITDYLEDINEIPKSRMFWPRQIWSKYVNKLEDLKHDENSEKAVECLNDMVMAIGTLALCYNNIEVFKGVVKLRRGKHLGLDKERVGSGHRDTPLCDRWCSTGQVSSQKGSPKRQKYVQNPILLPKKTAAKEGTKSHVKTPKSPKKTAA